MNFLDIQSCWEIPYIAHFCSLFSDAFKLPQFDIEDLEEALFADDVGVIGGSATASASAAGLLPDLIVRLLVGCVSYPGEPITTSNYQMYLRRLMRRKCAVSIIHSVLVPLIFVCLYILYIISNNTVTYCADTYGTNHKTRAYIAIQYRQHL